MITKALSILMAIGLVSSLILGKLWLDTRDNITALEIANKAVITQLEAATKANNDLIKRHVINDEVEVGKEQKLVVIEKEEDKIVEVIDKLPRKCTEVKNEKDKNP
jgi:Na+-translocating ferredoxin:NAD+ oxidoreductase RnfG subunit